MTEIERLMVEPFQRPVRTIAVLAFALPLLSLVVYSRCPAFDFVNFDDPMWVTDNIHVATGLEWDNVVWAFSARGTAESANWHPLTWLSLMLDVELFGVEAYGFHLTNILLHAANTLLLFVVLLRMTGNLWPSAFTAAVFGIHPMHVESVAWITERKDVLSAFFGFLSLYWWTSYVQTLARRAYGLSLAAFCLSLMSKQMLVTLPEMSAE